MLFVTTVRAPTVVHANRDSLETKETTAKVKLLLSLLSPGSLGGNGLTPEKEISLAGLSPLQNTFLAFSLSNIPRFHFGRSVTMSTRADLSQEIAYPLSSV